MDSWAISPETYKLVNDQSEWFMQSDTNAAFHADSSIEMTCEDWTEPVFFQTRFPPAFHLNGFYYPHQVIPSIGNKTPFTSCYLKIKDTLDEPMRYFFYSDSEHGPRWTIFTNITTEAAIGEAFLYSAASRLGEMEEQFWYILDLDNVWKTFQALVIHSESLSAKDVAYPDVYQALVGYRRVEYEKVDFLSAKIHILRNSYLMPKLGLATEDIPLESFVATVSSAITEGYLLVDLADHAFEQLFGQVYNDTVEAHRQRSIVFTTVKLVATELGFHATCQAISKSLRNMMFPFIDLYLLDRPICSTETTSATKRCEGTWQARWQDSWHALEKAYAEGRIMMMGVSNFEVSHLQELSDKKGVIWPHVVQSKVFSGDAYKKQKTWCDQHKVFYQFYSTLYNLPQPRQKITKGFLTDMINQYDISMHCAVIRYYSAVVAGGLVLRASNPKHQKSNVECFGFLIVPASQLSKFTEDPNVHIPKNARSYNFNEL